MALVLPTRVLGISCAIAATFIFSLQDAITKQLVETHSVWFILMVRFWVHLVVAVLWAASTTKGLKATVRTGNMKLQLMRGVLLFAEIALITISFSLLGLAEVTAVMMAHPLIATALAALFLGETVGWRRVSALCVGLIGLLIIVQPGGEIWGPAALVVLAAAFSFATYQLFTRMASAYDGAVTHFFYVGAVGAVLSTYMGVQHLPALADIEWLLLGAICISSICGHFSLMKALSLTLASDIQPFAYLQLVWAIPVGFIVFGDLPTGATVFGAALIVGAGLFSLMRQRKLQEARSESK
ncbi:MULTISPECIES: DMT family transporter [Pseudovibrio]|uniref:DMT family transporter n=1 Tax=Stappiaceae TaxID=2821832 RepID=UPI0023659BC3|nr:MULTISPECIES: DMT family transporter [Pseudovibrio]MDD7910954.1 DMT family transporter [Pseudovibrio exalbescens]MDX5593332.1 DMT family transporter [Pseudovibrio sp. SPO723]